MMQGSIAITIATFLLAASAFADGVKDARDPRAIEILRAADDAIRQLGSAAYEIEYDGLHWARGRLRARVELVRSGGLDVDFGTVGFELRADVSMIDTPAGHENYPARFTLQLDETNAWVIDQADHGIERAEGFDRLALAAALNTIVLPQYTRPEPFGLEMRDSIGMTYLGDAMVGDVVCDVIRLRFPDDSGFGEQLLYIGAADRLIRKATVVTPRSEAGPHGMMQMTIHALRADPPIPPGGFPPPEQNVATTFTQEDRAEGTRSPSWSVTLLDGRELRSEDLRGRVAVLVFWSSWCPTCHLFFPEVQRMYEHYAEDDVRIVAMNVFDTDDPEEFMETHGYTFDVGLDADSVIHDFRFVGAPAIAVVDGDGRIRYRQLGARPATDGNPGIWSTVDALLDRKR